MPRGVKSERRRSPRAKISVPLEIRRNRKVIEGRTRNISATGAYLTVDRFVPLNTELGVTIFLSGGGKPPRGKTRKVFCHGVVVRNEPAGRARKGASYGMALCFTDIARAEMRKLSEYIVRKLPEKEREKLVKGRLRMRRHDPGKVFSTGISGKREVRISSANFRVMGDEIALSKNGICCRTDRAIPLFREIAVNLVLPAPAGRAHRKESEAVQCSAVVVGCEKVPRSKKYDLAAYFVGLSRKQKERLGGYIKKIFES